MSGHVIKFEAKLFQLTTKKRVWRAGTWETPLLWWPEKFSQWIITEVKSGPTT